MSTVRLSGRLVCHDEREAVLVAQHLPLHVELTRAEPGCINFEVSPTGDPLVWVVEEEFVDATSFAAHQDRVTGSTWGRATAGIQRDYHIDWL